MDEAEGNKRIAFWEEKLVAYRRKNNKSGITRAEETIKRIKEAMGADKKHETKRTGSIVSSEQKRSIKSEDKGEGTDTGGLI
jgi:hypothetical protein